MVVSEALNALGAPGWVVVLAMVGFGLYHFRSLMAVFSQVGTVLWVAAVVVGLLAVATLGVVPGLDVDVMVVPETIADLLGGLWGAVRGFLPFMVGAVP